MVTHPIVEERIRFSILKMRAVGCVGLCVFENVIIRIQNGLFDLNCSKYLLSLAASTYLARLKTRIFLTVARIISPSYRLKGFLFSPLNEHLLCSSSDRDQKYSMPEPELKLSRYGPEQRAQRPVQSPTTL